MMKTIIKILTPLANLISIIGAAFFKAPKIYHWIKKILNQAKIKCTLHDIPDIHSLHFCIETNKPVKDITLSLTPDLLRPTYYSVKITPFLQRIGREDLEKIELHEENTKNKKIVKFDLPKRGAFRLIISASEGKAGSLFIDNIEKIEINAPNTKSQFKENRFLSRIIKRYYR